MNNSPVSLLDKHPPDQPILALDGQDWKRLIHGAVYWLERHHAAVNRLNVFPVPDGDTGTNMLLTLRKAWEEIGALHDDGIGPIAGKVAHGALMGARGNSGVILSQILRGMARAWDGKAQCDATTMVAAWQEGTDAAYKGVNKPVEGTILTVCREATEAAKTALQLDNDIRFLFIQLLQAAHRSLENTPNLLPVLKQAGVVDSGGMGLYVIIEAFTKMLQGETIMPVATEAAADEADLSELGDEWGYDIQFLLFTDKVTEHDVRQKLMDMGGESIVVGGSNGVIKVHVHSEDPGPFISYGASLGHLDDIVLENMTLQTLRRKGEWQEPGGSSIDNMVPQNAADLPPSALIAASTKIANKVGLIAVAPGPGLAEVFRSLGVDKIISGGQTMNPSTEEFVQAIDQLEQREIIILPNNSNILLAAQQSASLSDKEVVVLPTKTIPQGIAALLAHNPLAGLGEDAAAMKDGMQGVKSGQVTKAVSNAKFDDIQVKEGDFIGIGEGKLLSKGESLDEVVLDLLRHLLVDDAEIVTLYYGEPVRKEEADQLAEKVFTVCHDCDVEVVYGGQPYYHYILSVE